MACFFYGAAPPCGRVGLCRSSLLARPIGASALVWPFGPLLSIPQPAAALPPAKPIKRYSSLRSSCVNRSPPTHPFTGFLKESLGWLGPFAALPPQK